jgi:hypothetical protein
VATLLRTSLPAGPHTVSWDGTGRTGTPLASGVYLYRLEGTVPSPSRKLILLK